MMIALSPEGRDLVRATARPMVRILREYSNRFGAERLERLADELRVFRPSSRASSSPRHFPCPFPATGTRAFEIAQ